MRNLYKPYKEMPVDFKDLLTTGMMCKKCILKYSLNEGFNEVQGKLK